MKISRMLPGSESTIDVLFQLVLLVLIFSLAAWMWPAGMLGKPLGSLTASDWIWSSGAVLVSTAGAITAYFVILEPLVALIRGMWAMRKENRPG